MGSLVSKEIDNTVPANQELSQALGRVRQICERSLAETSAGKIISDVLPVTVGGKMLRARLVMYSAKTSDMDPGESAAVAAAVEMIHASSLLHDDVIDGGTIRRGAPAFWVERGATGAILLGDMMVCLALELLEDCGRQDLMARLVSLSREMCDGELEQELSSSRHDDWDTCISVARRKTGALFAFAASIGGSDTAMIDALSEAGYAIGTAYQLADDLLDASAADEGDGKSLGLDAQSDKITAATASAAAGIDPVEFIMGLRDEALRVVSAWPDAHRAVEAYIDIELRPVIDRFVDSYAKGMAAG